MADPSLSSPVDPPIAFCTNDGNMQISVMEATFLTRHFKLRGTDTQKHKALRDLINSMCATSVGRAGLHNLLVKAHEQ